MKTNRITMTLAAVLCAVSLSSCVFQQMAGRFSRDTYPGQMPPHVITDNAGKPASNNWIQVSPTDLPPSGNVTKAINYASDGLPYGLPCEFSNVIVSPYSPHYQLDYSGCKVGSKVWDPYTRKPFYIPRLYTIN